LSFHHHEIVTMRFDVSHRRDSLTYRMAGHIASRRDMLSRLNTLTFDYHRAVAALPDEQAKPLLAWAVIWRAGTWLDGSRPIAAHTPLWWRWHHGLVRQRRLRPASARQMRQEAWSSSEILQKLGGVRRGGGTNQQHCRDYAGNSLRDYSMTWDQFIDLLDTPIVLWMLFLIMPILTVLWRLTLVWCRALSTGWSTGKPDRRACQSGQRAGSPDRVLAVHSDAGGRPVDPGQSVGLLLIRRSVMYHPAARKCPFFQGIWHSALAE
jgi:hypothetical protein